MLENIELLTGKTIENIYYRDNEGELIIEFTDGLRISISAGMCDDVVVKVDAE